jgi:predicted transcriptional regulator
MNMPSSEVAVIDAEVVEVEPLSEGKARVLDKRIRQASARVVDNTAVLLGLLDEAAVGQIHVALGFSSWTAWVKDAVQVSPADEVERKSLVSLMSGKGMSQRAIASVVGVDQATVSRDLAEERGDADASTDVTGVDGKTYKPKPKKEKKQEPLDVEEVEEPRKATDVISDFRENMEYLEPAVQAFSDLLADDTELFEKARKRIAKSHLNPLGSMIADLQKVVDELMAP